MARDPRALILGLVGAGALLLVAFSASASEPTGGLITTGGPPVEPPEPPVEPPVEPPIGPPVESPDCETLRGVLAELWAERDNIGTQLASLTEQRDRKLSEAAAHFDQAAVEQSRADQAYASGDFPRGDTHAQNAAAHNDQGGQAAAVADGISSNMAELEASQGEIQAQIDSVMGELDALVCAY